MGILVNTGFDVGSSSPIDNRTVKNTTDERDALVTNGLVYENLKVYCKDTQTEYRWTGTDWETVGSSGSGGDLDLTDYQKKTDNTLTTTAKTVPGAINELDTNKLDKPEVDGTAGQILVLQDDGSLAYEDNVGSGNVEAMADLILDTEVRIDKTYSSSKIYTDIQQCLEDSKTYTLEELGKKIGASYEVVTSTDDMVSQDRLYLLNNDNNYDIYIVDVNNVPVVIGDTSIDLSGYVTKTEIESELGTERLGTTSQTVKGAINELFQSVTNEGDITDLENRVTTNETNITDLQEQIDNLDIPEDVDLTEINNKLTRLETKQINKATIVYMQPTPVCYKITPKDNNTFSKILIVDLYGGCLLITGSMIPDYKSLKAVRLSNGCWESYSASNNVANKIESVYYDGSYIYVNCLNYIKINFEGGFTNIEKIDSLPSNTTQIPILDLTQQTDLTGINTKLSQLETKATLIPVVGDNPTDYDLNNYRENGNYSIGIPANYSNVPEVSSGLLTVTRSNTFRLQVYTVINNNNVYFRKSNNGGNSWSSWVLLNGSSGGSGNDIYTDTQQEIGTWVNGKTLYRKTIKSNGTKSPITNMSVNVTTVDLSKYRVVKVEGVQRIRSSSSSSANPLTYPIPYFVSNGSELSSILVAVDDNNNVFITTKNLSDYYDYGYDITIYYTDK